MSESPVAGDPAEQRCDMSVRTSALPSDQSPVTEHVGDDVYLDRNEYGEVVGVEVLDARAVTINGVPIVPFPGEFRAVGICNMTRLRAWLAEVDMRSDSGLGVVDTDEVRAVLDQLAAVLVEER
jgi:hypothetical protein